MKRFVLSLLISFLWLYGYSQSQFSVNIGVIVPQQQVEINAETFQLLKTKLKSIANRNGVSTDMFGEFIIYPIANVIEKSLVEGGLKNMYIAEVELALFVRQLSNGAEYGSCEVLLKGTGDNVSNAVKNAFTKINVSDEIYKSFFVDCKKNIEGYYVANKSAIINKANTLAKLQKYQEALTLLMTYPENLDGYDEIQQAAIQVYTMYQNAVCSQMIAEARSAIAIQDYVEALNVLAKIDSESNCNKEALSLINEVKEQIQAEQKLEYDFVNKLIDNEQELKEKRIEAIKEIAVEFARHNQPKISYTQIIK